MTTWMRKNLGRLLCIFGLAVLLLYITYKAGFGAMPTSDIEGKTRGTDLPTIKSYMYSGFSSVVGFPFCFVCDTIAVCVYVRRFKFGHRLH